MSQLEAPFRRHLLTKLRRIPLSWWERIEQRDRGGTPDILGVIQGLFIAIETKTVRGKVSELQRAKLSCIETVGGFASAMTPENEEEEMLRLIAHVEKTRTRR